MHTLTLTTVPTGKAAVCRAIRDATEFLGERCTVQFALGVYGTVAEGREVALGDAEPEEVREAADLLIMAGCEVRLDKTTAAPEPDAEEEPGVAYPDADDPSYEACQLALIFMAQTDGDPAQALMGVNSCVRVLDGQPGEGVFKAAANTLLGTFPRPKLADFVALLEEEARAREGR